MPARPASAGPGAHRRPGRRRSARRRRAARCCAPRTTRAAARRRAAAERRCVPAARRPAHQIGHPVVGGRVVHHDDLEVRVVLAEHRRQAAAQPLGAVPGADHHAGRRRVQQRRRPADQVRRRPGQPKPAVAQRLRAVGGRSRLGGAATGAGRLAATSTGGAALGIARGRAPGLDLLPDGQPERLGDLAGVGRRRRAAECPRPRAAREYQRASTRADSWPGAVMPLTGSLSSTSQTFTGCKLIV